VLTYQTARRHKVNNEIKFRFVSVICPTVQNRSRHQPASFRYFMVSFSFSKRVPQGYLQRGHDRFPFTSVPIQDSQIVPPYDALFAKFLATLSLSISVSVANLFRLFQTHTTISSPWHVLEVPGPSRTCNRNYLIITYWSN